MEYRGPLSILTLFEVNVQYLHQRLTLLSASHLRSGKATERFEERMKSIEKMNSLKTKSRFAPVAATVGRFSSAFRRFEGTEDDSHSTDSKSSTLKARHSSVTASLSVGSDRTQTAPAASPMSPPTVKKLPRSPYIGSLPRDLNKARSMPEKADGNVMKGAEPRLRVSADDSRREDRLSRTQQPSKQAIQHKSPTTTPSKTRSVKLPVESGRMIRAARDSNNAPDVVPTALQERSREKTPTEEPAQQFELTTEAQAAMTFEPVSSMKWVGTLILGNLNSSTSQHHYIKYNVVLSQT